VKGIKIEGNIDEILVNAGVDLHTIDSAIWSHWHWDHVGRPEKFPPSTEIIVGPGSRPCLDANLENRAVREISFDKSGLQIGQLPAIDLFGDGSLYLLSTPGHAVGHMCALARTTVTTFVFLGGDICHFPGMFRPSSHLPLQDTIPQDQLDDHFPIPCPCDIFTSCHPLQDPASEEAKSSQFFNVTSRTPSSYHNREEAMQSISAMQDFDASDDVLVLIAHDPTLLKVLPLLNDAPLLDLNDWKERGYKARLQWGWLNELPRDGRPGRSMLVEGAWHNGRGVRDFREISST